MNPILLSRGDKQNGDKEKEINKFKRLTCTKMG